LGIASSRAGAIGTEIFGSDVIGALPPIFYGMLVVPVSICLGGRLVA